MFFFINETIIINGNYFNIIEDEVSFSYIFRSDRLINLYYINFYFVEYTYGLVVMGVRLLIKKWLV